MWKINMPNDMFSIEYPKYKVEDFKEGDLVLCINKELRFASIYRVIEVDSICVMEEILLNSKIDREDSKMYNCIFPSDNLEYLKIAYEEFRSLKENHCYTYIPTNLILKDMNNKVIYPLEVRERSYDMGIKLRDFVNGTLVWSEESTAEKNYKHYNYKNSEYNYFISLDQKAMFNMLYLALLDENKSDNNDFFCYTRLHRRIKYDIMKYPEVFTTDVNYNWERVSNMVYCDLYMHYEKSGNLKNFDFYDDEKDELITFKSACDENDKYCNIKIINNYKYYNRKAINDKIKFEDLLDNIRTKKYKITNIRVK